MAAHKVEHPRNKHVVFLGCLAALALLLIIGGYVIFSPPKPACIDLGKYYNATLTTSLNSPSYVRENNLAALLHGRQAFSGVPFEVGGVLQLSGKNLQEWGRTEFPEEADGVRVGRKFSELHLLHGAGGVSDPDGTTIATLVLHYADGSSRPLELKSGVNVRDWWGNPSQPVTGANSKLAWTGTNPALKQYSHGNTGALRIYTTTFKNPQPRIRATTIDFKSAMKNSSPFLIALTVQ